MISYIKPGVVTERSVHVLISAHVYCTKLCSEYAVVQASTCMLPKHLNQLADLLGSGLGVRSVRS